MAGRIRKKQNWCILHGSPEDDEKEPISYCPRCQKQSYLSILRERIYSPGQPIPSDHEYWKQCHNCGQIVPIYELKKESRLKDFVETSSNPFDQGKTITGIGNKVQKPPLQKQRKKLKDRIEQEKDKDIQAELRKGNIVQIIE